MSKTAVIVRAAVALGIGLVASLLLAPALMGQQSLALTGHGGMAIPTGRFADLARPGPTMGVQVNYTMTPRTALTLRSDFDQLGGARIGTARAPDMNLWRYGLGLERTLIGPRERRAVPGRGSVARLPQSRWSVRGDIGLGAARFDSKSFTPSGGGGSRDFNKTYLETNAGLTVNYDATSKVRLFAGARGSLSFADEGDTAVLAALDPQSRVKPFGSTVTVPVSAGLRIRM